MPIDDPRIQTRKVFPDEDSKTNAIETLASCVYITTNEIMAHNSLRDLPVEVAYHIGLGIQIIGAMIGKIELDGCVCEDLTSLGKDYDVKIELVTDSLIRIRDEIRKKGGK